MLINTRDFGEVNISDNEILTFPDGIYAFEDNHKFVLLSPCGENQPMWLQSLDNVNLCFIVFDPQMFVSDYSAELDETVKNKLNIKDSSAVEYLVIAVIPDEYVNTTVNLKSPIVVNPDCGMAEQIIAIENYPIKFPAFKKEEI